MTLPSCSMSITNSCSAAEMGLGYLLWPRRLGNGLGDPSKLLSEETGAPDLQKTGHSSALPFCISPGQPEQETPRWSCEVKRVLWENNRKTWHWIGWEGDPLKFIYKLKNNTEPAIRGKKWLSQRNKLSQALQVWKTSWMFEALAKQFHQVKVTAVIRGKKGLQEYQGSYHIELCG